MLYKSLIYFIFHYLHFVLTDGIVLSHQQVPIILALNNNFTLLSIQAITKPIIPPHIIPIGKQKCSSFINLFLKYFNTTSSISIHPNISPNNTPITQQRSIIGII